DLSEALHLEKAGHALVVIYAGDGLGQQVGHAEHANGQAARIDGDGIGGDELVDHPAAEAFVGDLAEEGVADGRAHADRAVGTKELGGVDQGAGGLGDVVDDEHILAGDVADDVDGFDGGGTGALFPDHAEAGAEDAGVGGGHLHAADVGRDDHEVFALEAFEVFEEDRRGEEVIDRDVEEALDLLA